MRSKRGLSFAGDVAAIGLGDQKPGDAGGVVNGWCGARTCAPAVSETFIVKPADRNCLILSTGNQ